MSPGRGDLFPPSQEGLGLDFVDATFRIDGELRSDRISLSTSRFVFLFVFIESKGMYIVSAEKTEDAVIAGQFTGPQMTIHVSGTRIELKTVSGHVFSDGLDRSAWVEYLPEYDLFGPGAKAGDAVIGLAARKNLIPGFIEQDQ